MVESTHPHPGMDTRVQVVAEGLPFLGRRQPPVVVLGHQTRRRKTRKIEGVNAKAADLLRSEAPLVQRRGLHLLPIRHHLPQLVPGLHSWRFSCVVEL